jgi:hypothetical protein
MSSNIGYVETAALLFLKKKKQKIFDWLRLGAGDDNAQGPD